MPIARRIIQTQCTEEIGRGHRDTWKAYHPDWAYHFYDDEACRQFIAERMPRILPTYDKLPLPVQKADLFRYAAVYELGGVYADVDTICCAPVDSYISMAEDQMVVGLEMSPAQFRGQIQKYQQQYCAPFQLLQWTFAAPQKHSALALMIQRIDFYASQASVAQLKAWSVSVNFTLALTGPMLFTQVITEFLAGSRVGKVAVLLRLVWGALPWEQRNPNLATKMRVKHLFEGGWKPKSVPKLPQRPENSKTVSNPRA